MTEEKKVKTEETKEAPKKPGAKKEAASNNGAPKTKRKFVNKKPGSKRGGRRSSGRPKSDYEQKIVSLRRVTRVVAGGRRFSFSVAIVIGDKSGSVGVGSGKSTDTSLAIEKAVRVAKKNLIRPNLTKNNSIPFDVDFKYNSSKIIMAPAPGRGLKAGGAMRVVLELLGAKDITGKILSRSKNHLNNAKATIEALKKIGYKSGSLKRISQGDPKSSKKTFVKKLVTKETKTKEKVK